jgi:hypothetical protein
MPTTDMIRDMIDDVMKRMFDGEICVKKVHLSHKWKCRME